MINTWRAVNTFADDALQVNETLSAINVESLADTVALGAEIVVNEQLSTINLVSLNDVVDISEAVIVLENVTNINITSINDTVVVGSAVTTAPQYTISFKDTGYTVSYKQ